MKTTLKLTAPAPQAQINLQALADYIFEFAFPLDEARFMQQNHDLVIVFSNQALIVIEDFFETHTGLQPVFLMEDGQTVNAAVLLSQHGLLDNSGTSDAGSGLNAYFAGTRGLAEGIERLDDRLTDVWQGEVLNALGNRPAGPLAAADYLYPWITSTQRPPLPAPPENRDAPQGPGPESAEYDDRFVLYLPLNLGRSLSADDQALAARTSYSITGAVQAAHPPAGPDPAYGASSEKGWGTVSINGDGSITYTLTETSLLQDAQRHVDYASYTDNQGKVQRVQVVINKDGGFHTDDAILGHTVNGETHLSYVTSQTYKVTASQGTDIMYFNNLCGNGQALCLDTGGGDDSIYITAAEAAMNGVVEGFCGLSTADAIARLNSGNNLLDIQAQSSGSAATGVNSAQVLMGAGNDTLKVTVAASGDATGFASAIADRALVRLGGGSDVMDVDVRSAAGNVAVLNNTQVYAGDGDSSISLQGRVEASAQAVVLDGSRVDLGTGNDSLKLDASGYIAVALLDGGISHAGQGDAGIAINVDGPALAAAIWGGTVSLGNGNDTLALDVTSAGGGATGVNEFNQQGLYFAAGINMGEGDNLLTVSARGIAATGIAKAPLTMGGGNDSIDITASASGAYSSATGLSGSSVSLGTGHDSLRVSASSSLSGDASGISSTNITHNGLGNALIEVSATSARKADGAYGGTITTGNGNDTLSFQANGVANSCYGYYSPDISTGAGDDSLSIGSRSAGVTGGSAAAAYGTGYGSINLGPGRDSLSISATGTAHNATSVVGTAISHEGLAGDSALIAISAESAANAMAMQGQAKITTAGGDDSITVTARGQGAGVALSGSSVVTGAGRDSISISAESTNSYALALTSASRLDCSGTDAALITISALGAAFVNGMDGGSTLLAGAGDDTIRISAVSTGASSSYNSFALSGGSVATGNGNDALYLSAKSSGGAAYASSGAISMGDGDNFLSLKAESENGNAYGQNGSSLLLGDGNNTVNIYAHSGSATAYGLNSTSLATGAGDDLVRFELSGSSAYAMSGSSLNLGAGDDTVVLAGAGLSGNNTINAGSGLDVLLLERDGTLALGTGSGELNLGGVEFLDLGQGAGNAATVSLSASYLDTLLDSMDSVDGLLDSASAAATKGLFVQGDSQDSLVFTDSASVASTGHTFTHGSVTYDEYAVGGDNSLLIYIQNGVSLS